MTTPAFPASLERLIAVLPDAVNAAMRKVFGDRHTPEVAARLADDMADRLRRAYTVPSTQVHAELAGIGVGQCCARRPDRDQLTGHRLDGQDDTDDTFPDRLLCVEKHAHDGDHRDTLSRTWPRTEVPA
jgi:hypothetical protein